MIIGGDDIIVDGAPHPNDAWFIVCRLREQWPDGVMQGGEETQARTLCAAYGMREFFMYSDLGSFELWRQQGGTPAAQPTMLHVILGETSSTFVVDRRDSPVGKFVVDLTEALVAERAKWERERPREPWGVWVSGERLNLWMRDPFKDGAVDWIGTKADAEKEAAEAIVRTGGTGPWANRCGYAARPYVASV